MDQIVEANSKFRTAILICYFGKWPPWIDIFIRSCSLNPEFHFILFTDCEYSKLDYHNNITIVPFSLSEFSSLASRTLNLKINVTVPHKICDFKPAFGEIFADYLVNFDFWGYSDIDLVFGDIKRFVSDELLRNNDVITAKREYLVGHFTLYRNIDVVCRLFTRSRDYRRIFMNANHTFCFDECGQLWFDLLKGIPLYKLKSRIVSMTHVVMQCQRDRIITAYFGDHVIEQDTFDANNRLIDFDQVLIWNDGCLTSQASGEEFMYFHFHFLKSNSSFVIPNWVIVPNEFMVSKNGFA